ncbi:MAG: YDG domain-containing protein, partial [Pirellulales bacterium]|nr:YDG domain-containing protein [Pirellulales bacterium]
EDEVYDGTTDATLNLEDAALEGVVDGEDVVLVTTEAAAAFDDADAGEGKPLTVTGLSLGGAQSANYTLAEAVLAADITAKTLSVTGITVEDKVYDGTTDATLNLEDAALEGVVDGEDVVLVTTEAAAAFADPEVGEGKPVTVTGLSLSGAQSANYMLADLVLTADITA